MVALNRPKSSRPRSRILAHSAAAPKTKGQGHEASSTSRRRDSGRDPASLEEDCRILAERLDHVERTSNELVSTLAHDLRNPLSVILVSAKLLTRGLGADHASKRHVDAVARAADEINQMLQDMTDASSIERGRLSLACEPRALAPLAERAIAAVELAATSKGIAIEKQFAPDLPQILAEPERLVKVFQHLLVNALKFTPRGGKIVLGLEPEGDGVRVSISDDGPGIADEVQPFAYSRMGNGKKPHAQGVGLGLFVTKGIVEAHGGEVWMESKIGGGSRFGFHLPKAPKGDGDDGPVVAG